uniref:Uncharacterized protein n=1 Tax=Leersia perrieri TaxID=77586 RepID=A0A0D9X1W7_9ORYZ
MEINWVHTKSLFRPSNAAHFMGNKAETTHSFVVPAFSSTHFFPFLPSTRSNQPPPVSAISAAAAVAVAAMGRGRNRGKAGNFATFRLCPRPGAADASDRVFVRVDTNPYSVPGFADDQVNAGAGTSSAGDEDDGGAAGPLPEHVRREIVELGLPDDEYDYLPHLREIRPSVSSIGGGGSSAAFLPARRLHSRAHFGPPLDTKAYDASRIRIGSGEATAETVEVTRVENAIDPDVARLLEKSDDPALAGLESGSDSEHDNLEEDFVLVANQLEEDFVLVANHPEEEDDNIVAVDDAACKGENSAIWLSYQSLY